MRPRNYSVLSKAEAEVDTSYNDTSAELEFLQELEDAIESMGANRFTVDGRPVTVAAETRAKLGKAIKELTQVQINQIADGAEKFGNKDQRVLLEVVQGEDKPDAQLKFPDTDVTAQYIYYTEEQKEDARLLMELKRIQYLQNVVMKQLEMTDRSGSSQVVQGMIAAGQKFVQGLTAVFKQVETLSKQIEKGLQNKADMPTAEQKTAAVAAITQALRALPAVDPRHIAVKNLVMQQVERLQAKFNMVPAAPRASATILQMKAPTADATKGAAQPMRAETRADAKTVPTAKGADAAVKGNDAKVVATAKTAPLAKVDAKAAPVAKGQTAELRVDAKGQPIAPLAKVDAKAAPVAKGQTAELRVDAKGQPIAPLAKVDAQTQTQVKGTPVAVQQTRADAAQQVRGATVTSITPNVTAQQAIARASTVTSPVHTMQQSLANALGITRPVAGVAQPAPAQIVTAQVQHQAQPIAQQQAQPQQSQPQAQQVQPQQTQQQAQPQQSQPQDQIIQPVQQQPQQIEPQQVQQQPVQQVVHINPNTGVANHVEQPINMQSIGAQQTGAQVTGAQPIAVQPNTVQPIVTQISGTQVSGTQVGGTQVIGAAPIVAPQQGQPVVAQVVIDNKGQPIVADAGVKGVEVRSVPAGSEARADTTIAKGQPAEARQTDKSQPAEDKKADNKGVENKLPERPTERTEAKGGEQEIKEKKEVKVDEGPCGGCGRKGIGCGTCGITGTVKTNLIPSDKNVDEAKKTFPDNANPCTSGNCGGCRKCARADADPAVTANATKDAQAKYGPRRAATVSAPAPGKAA